MYSRSYKAAVTQGVYGAELGAFGESLARWDNFCDGTFRLMARGCN